MDSTQAIRNKKSRLKVRGSPRRRLKSEFPFCPYHIPYGEESEHWSVCPGLLGTTPTLYKSLKHTRPRKPLRVVVKRANDAPTAKPGKHDWWVGVQGSFKQIREALQDPDRTRAMRHTLVA